MTGAKPKITSPNQRAPNTYGWQIALQPSVDEGRETHHLRVQVDHAAPRDGRRRRHGQVRHLEDHPLPIRHLHDLTTGQAELLVVI